MLRLSLRNLGAHKWRLVGTALSVIIGIAFLAGTFVFTDTIQRTFDNLFANVYENTDAVVRSNSSQDIGFGSTIRNRIPAETVEQVQGIDGVTVAVGDVQGYARIIDADGNPVGMDNGPPTFGNSIADSEILPWRVSDGRLPSGDTEMAMDAGSFDNGDFSLGDQVQVNSQAGSQEFTLVGVVKFGEEDSPGGATFAFFDLPTAEAFVGKPGEIDNVLVQGDGLSQQELVDTLQAGLGNPSLEVVTGETVTEENQDSIQEGLQFFNYLLLVFAGVALFVSIFIIYNTFSIIVAQRQRETALLRAIGASRRQVVGSLLIESIVIGFVASLVGLVGGIGLAVGLTKLLSAFGVDIPSEGVVLLPRTIVASLIVGVVITTIASVAPALNVPRVPPVAAMRAVAIEDFSFSRRRFAIGMVLLVLGVIMVAVGLAGTVAMLAAGIPLMFVALFVLGPLIARPVAGILGKPLPRLRGVTGVLARENAMRNPKRTARTAAALMVGVALVSGISVLASSIKSSVRDIIGEQFTGDFVVSTNTFGFGGLSPQLASQLNELPEVKAAAGVQLGFGTIDGDVKSLSVVDPAVASQVFDFDMLEGSMSDLTDEGVLISKSTADDRGLAVGDTLTVTLLDGTPRDVTVQGIYDKDELAGPYTVSNGFYAQGGADQFDFSVYIVLADGVSDAEAEPALRAVTDQFPAGDLQSRTEYIDAQASSIDGFVNLVYGLLALAVIIALVGIANTLSLSIYERTRELGLIRAVGGSRKQVRTTIRWESVITALLGTAQGIIVGILLGYAVIVALRDEGLSRFTLPVGTLVFVVVLAFICGVLAAFFPARRAARLNVLDAISHD